MIARRSASSVVALALALSVFLSRAGCAGSLPWGAGGPDLAEPADAVPAAIVRNFGPAALARASDRLALATRDALAAGVTMPDRTAIGDGWVVAWQGLSFAGSNLELRIVDGRLVARVEVPAQSADLDLLFEDDPSYHCACPSTIGPGTLDLPIAFVVDKLGRMTGQVVGTATWSGAVDTPSTAASCLGDPTGALV